MGAAADLEDGTHDDGSRWWLGPILPAVAFITIGLLYAFPLGMVLHHKWLVPSDILRPFVGDRYFVRGDLGQGLRYSTTPGYVSTPGTSILMLPPSGLASWLHEWLSPRTEPTAWLSVGPYIVAAGSSFIFAVDALARRLGLAAERRSLLNWLSIPFALVVVVGWGHPEDVVALGLGLYGFAMAIDRRWSRVGWLFSLAACLQPLTLLLLPPVLALTGPRQWWRVALRVPVVTLLVVAAPLAVDPRSVVRYLHEPNNYVLNHEMPLGWISPGDGYHLITPFPERAAVLLLAVAIGWWAWRHHPTPMDVVWYGALAMACRFFLEPVVTPYYLWPAVALLLVIVVARPSPLAWLATYLFTAASVLVYLRMEPWAYFLALLAPMAVALAVLRPGLGADVPAVAR